MNAIFLRLASRILFVGHHRSCTTSSELTTARDGPLLVDESHERKSSLLEPRQAWIERLDTSLGSRFVGLINLHPDIFSVLPRIDLIHANVVWQTKYKFVNRAHTKTRAEVRGGGRKPWPQKGTGRSRHGSIRSPLWKGGGQAHGPRCYTTSFYMLPHDARVHGLTHTLSAKFAQDDLKVVDSLDIASDESQFIESLCEERRWGSSVLFVDDTSFMPRNITMATDSLGNFNLMPVYGLNVYSMLKHETLVLTVAAVKKIEERLLFHLYSPSRLKLGKKFYK